MLSYHLDLGPIWAGKWGLLPKKKLLGALLLMIRSMSIILSLSIVLLLIACPCQLISEQISILSSVLISSFEPYGSRLSLQCLDISKLNPLAEKSMVTDDGSVSN